MDPIGYWIYAREFRDAADALPLKSAFSPVAYVRLSIAGVIGYNRANASPTLKLFLSRTDDLIARVSKKFGGPPAVTS